MKKYIAEFLGTFTLALLVSLSIGTSISAPAIIPTPVVAGLVLLFFVYSIGSISGCHINPAVTVGLLSIRKISLKHACGYLIAQFLGGLVALYTSSMILGKVAHIGTIASSDPAIFFAELCGTFLFAFGIASVVYGKVEKGFSGIMIGASLLLGILAAVFLGSNGVLNPAVALGISSFNILYLLGPICGSILGMQLFSFLIA